MLANTKALEISGWGRTNNLNSTNTLGGHSKNLELPSHFRESEKNFYYFIFLSESTYQNIQIFLIAPHWVHPGCNIFIIRKAELNLIQHIEEAIHTAPCENHSEELLMVGNVILWMGMRTQIFGGLKATIILPWIKTTFIHLSVFYILHMKRLFTKK